MEYIIDLNEDKNGSNSTHQGRETEYVSVIFNKKDSGKLILDDSQISFVLHNRDHANNNSSMSQNENDVNMESSSTADAKNSGNFSVRWSDVVKHQVSPVSHPKALLKIILTKQTSNKRQNTGSMNGTKDTSAPDDAGRHSVGGSGSHSSSSSELTFHLQSREVLELIRKDISNRIRTFVAQTKTIQSQTNIGVAGLGTSSSVVSSRKRSYPDDTESPLDPTHTHSHKDAIVHYNDHGQYIHSFTRLHPVLVAVTRSCILSSDVSLRSQHSLLVSSSTPSSSSMINPTMTPSSTLDTVSESDFWNTHWKIHSLHAAKIIGLADPGRSSTIRSSLDIQSGSTTTTLKKQSLPSSDATSGPNANTATSGGTNTTSTSATAATSSNAASTTTTSTAVAARFVSIGVEEMREIFLMYPAVHRAYEEKVPLELSEEQFWKKYLQSEFFHRDRGRLGTHVNQLQLVNTSTSSKGRMGTLRGENRDDMKSSVTNIHGNDEGSKKTATTNATNTATANATASTSMNTEKQQEENARVAAASTDDIFSRADMEIQREQSLESEKIKKGNGTQSLAIGQFDLASTYYTERGGKLLLLQHHGLDAAASNNFAAAGMGSNPMSSSSASMPTTSSSVNTSATTSKRVIDKYNRHWALVLNPHDATAGCNFTSLARQSIQHVLEADEDALRGGGIDSEMRRLVRFANSKQGHVDYVRCIGEEVTTHLDDKRSNTTRDSSGNTNSHAPLFQELHLKNIGAYSGQTASTTFNGDMGVSQKQTLADAKKDLLQRNVAFSKLTLERIKTMVSPCYTKDGQSTGSSHNVNDVMVASLKKALPDAAFGREILKALTKRMVEDSLSDTDAQKLTSQFPDEFKQLLASYFRRCSELLRHFFTLRRVLDLEIGSAVDNSSEHAGGDRAIRQKLKKIVKGMEAVYREMESVRKSLPLTENGENMRKMYLSIMDQLDWAFKLNRDGSGGGFVTVEDDQD